MSKTGKSKITLELPKAKNLSDRLSVFQRLGNRGVALTKEKLPKPSLSDKEGPSGSATGNKGDVTPTKHQPEEQIIQQPEEPFPNASLKLQLVRQKAAQIMDSKRKQEAPPPPVIMNVVKKVRKIRVSSPSTDSSSSSSGSSSSSSSSSPKRKMKKRQIRKRAPSSSSEEIRERERKVSKKKAHKKSSELKRLHHKKSKEAARALMKRAISPPASYSRHHESESPERKHHAKVKKEKVYRHESIDHEREIYEKQLMRERRRSPSPRMVHRSRSPTRSGREMKQRISPEVRRSPPRGYRERSDDRSPYKESRVERERREAIEYERMREKERAEALARCQERQRERERLKQLEIEKLEQRRQRSVEKGRRAYRGGEGGSSRERSHSYTRERPPSRGEREYERHYESPVQRGRPIDDRSPMARGEYVARRDETPYAQERHTNRRYEPEETPVHHEKVRRSHGDYERPDHRLQDDRRPPVNYERPEHPQREWDRSGPANREHQPPHKEWNDRRNDFEEKEHYVKERPHYKQYHENPKGYDPPHHLGTRQQEMQQHHPPMPQQHQHPGQGHLPRGPPKKYIMQHGNERAPGHPTYRHPRPNMMNPRHERPEGQTYRPRMHHMMGTPRPPFRPTGPRTPGTYHPRHTFHPNITYFPNRQKNPMLQQQVGLQNQVPQQPLGQQQQGLNKDGQARPGRTVLKRQDGAEEDHLSEISDEGDDILGKNEARHLNRVRLQQRNQRQFGQGTLQHQQHSNMEDPKNGGDPSVKEEMTGMDTKSHANKQLQEEMELDFEEISDGELDEENKIKSLGDALGVDWASIVEESKRKMKEESQPGVNLAKKKLQPHRVILEIGISKQMAGEEFATQVLKDAYAHMQEEITAEIKPKSGAIVKSEFDGKEIKEEPIEEDITEKKPDTTEIEAKLKEKLPFFDTEFIAHPYAFAQIAYQKRIEERKKLLVNSIGPYSRALSARQDLKIRRRLCGLPEEELIERNASVAPSTIVVATPVINTSTAVTVEEEPTVITKSPAVERPSTMQLAFKMFKKAIEGAC